MKKIVSAVIAAMSLYSISAFADNSRYLMIDTGPVTMSNAGTMSNPSSFGLTYGHLASDSGSSIKGYVEYSFVGFGDSTSTDNIGTLTISQYSWQVAGVFAFPISDTGLDVTARIGGSYNHASLTGTGSYSAYNNTASTTGLIYGCGARYNFNDRFALNVRYDYLGKFIAQIGATGVDESRVMAGLQYNY